MLRLPGDIRNQIYEHVIANHIIYSLCHHGDCLSCHGDCAKSIWFNHKGFTCVAQYNGTKEQLPAVRLIRTLNICKAIHTEARLLVFSNTEYLFQNLSDEQCRSIQNIALARGEARFLPDFFGNYTYWGLKDSEKFADDVLNRRRTDHALWSRRRAVFLEAFWGQLKSLAEVSPREKDCYLCMVSY
jgi:hypothetical protein